MVSSSRAGTMIGGWLTIRYWPSTRSPSLERVCRLSRVWALAAVRCAVFCARLAAFAAFLEALDASAAALWTPFRSSSSARWAYEMSNVPIAAKLAIASR